MSRLNPLRTAVVALAFASPLVGEQPSTRDRAANSKPNTAYISVVSKYSPDAAGPLLVRYGLTRNDWYRLRSTVPTAGNSVGFRCVASSARHRDAISDVVVVGCSNKLMRLVGLEMTAGRFFSESENKTAENVCVIGQTVAQRLFGDVKAIGKNIRIDRDFYLIVGVTRSSQVELESVSKVYSELGLRAGRSTPNLEVHIPIRTMKSRMGDTHLIRNAGTFEGRTIELSEVWIPAGERPAALRQVLNNLLSKPDGPEQFLLRDRMAFSITSPKRANE